MKQWSQKPVIIASSLTGLLISYSLSKKKIEHILVGGDEPGEQPKLGESMNELSSADFWLWLEPEFRQFFHTKSHISLFHGDIASMIYIGNPNRKLDELPLEYGDRPTIPKVLPALIHVDRTGFDKALYHKVKESEYCTLIHCPQSNVIYDKSSDKITGIDLGEGRLIKEPTFVFDATGAFGLIARAAGISKTPTTAPQHVIWTHRYRPSTRTHSCEPASTREWWLSGTNLLHLNKDSDGVDGISWLIPLGDRLSIGLSVPAQHSTANKEELYKLLLDAYLRRGLDLVKSHPETIPLQELKHSYFQRDRGYGANWILAGGGYLQAWFPSSAGVGTSLAAAHLAPLLLQDPKKYGAIYESTLKDYLSFHSHLAKMIADPGYTTPEQLYTFWSRWLAFIPGRLTHHFRLYNGELESNHFEYRLGEMLSKFSLKYTSLHLLSVGLAQIRAVKTKQLSEQGHVFAGYFHQPTFILKNYLVGWPRYLWFRIKSIFSRSNPQTLPQPPLSSGSHPQLPAFHEK